MLIKPLSQHYSFENPATVYDEEALTVLQLCARLGLKINELIKAINEQNDYIIKEIPDNVQTAVRQWLQLHPDAATYVSPEMFGGVGDGVADDTAAIQAAIDNLADSVGNVYLLAGQYRITSPITIKNNITVIGAGSAKYGRHNSDIPTTVLFFDGEDVEESMINYDRNGETVFGGGFRNLTLDGNDLVNYVVDLRSAGRVVIDNCAIVNSIGAGVYASYCYENIISNNWFGGHAGYAIMMDSIANANTVVNNAIELSSSSSGILLKGCNGNTIQGNTIEGGFNTSVGILVRGGSYTTQNMIINNRIEFESHRYNRETEGICIQIGEPGVDYAPKRNYVYANSVFNQVIFNQGDQTVINHLNEFVDYGYGTITDFYDYTNINPNPKMLAEDERIIGFEPLDDGFYAFQNERYTTIQLQDADYEYPVYYRLIDGKQYRGENIAVSCKLNAKEKPISVDLEFYRGGTTQGWEGKGNLIERHTAKTLDVGYDELLHLQAVVPYECDTIAVYFNFRDQLDSRANIYWLKIGNNVTWR